jgi:adenosylhomocysteine nucleosidase
MIAVAFALPNESSEFVRLLDLRHETTRGLVGTLHGQKIHVLHVGVGAHAAHERLGLFLSEPPLPKLMISAGFAGALDDRLAVGDVLLGENFSDPRPAAAVQDASIQRGKLVSSEAILDSPAERERLATTTGAIAVDMETQAVHASCRLLGVPMLSLRAITDTPRLPFPAPPAVLFDLEEQRTNAARLAGYLMTHPLAIPKLVAFAKRVKIARRRLTTALDQVLRVPLV